MIDLENDEKITLDKLIRREYDGRECIAFDYVLQLEDRVTMEFTFRRDTNARDNSWFAWGFLPLDYDTGLRETLYCYVTLPVQMVSLVTIAACCLNALKGRIVDRIQQLQAVQFRVAVVTEGL